MVNSDLGLGGGGGGGVGEFAVRYWWWVVVGRDEVGGQDTSSVLGHFGMDWTLEHIMREDNKAAAGLANYARVTHVVDCSVLCLLVNCFAVVGLVSGHVFEDMVTNSSYCVYNSDVATGYGVGSFLFLLSSQSLLMGVTRCMCFGRPLTPGSDRAWSIIYFMSSWLTFLVAQTCVIAGAKTNAYHTKYREAIYAQNLSCAALRKGVFIAGAVFVVANMILNIYYYVYFSKATSGQATKKANRASSTVGMTGYA
ncbi:unnamed protein product [Rhodiola kirilowii]